jgi:hypothetical protein
VEGRGAEGYRPACSGPDEIRGAKVGDTTPRSLTLPRSLGVQCTVRVYRRCNRDADVSDERKQTTIAKLN